MIISSKGGEEHQKNSASADGMNPQQRLPFFEVERNCNQCNTKLAAILDVDVTPRNAGGSQVCDICGFRVPSAVDLVVGYHYCEPCNWRLCSSCNQTICVENALAFAREKVREQSPQRPRSDDSRIPREGSSESVPVSPKRKKSLEDMKTEETSAIPSSNANENENDNEGFQSANEMGGDEGDSGNDANGDHDLNMEAIPLSLAHTRVEGSLEDTGIHGGEKGDDLVIGHNGLWQRKMTDFMDWMGDQVAVGVGGGGNATCLQARRSMSAAQKLYPDGDSSEIGHNFLIATKAALTGENAYLIHKNKQIMEEMERLKLALEQAQGASGGGGGGDKSHVSSSSNAGIPPNMSTSPSPSPDDEECVQEEERKREDIELEEEREDTPADAAAAEEGERNMEENAENNAEDHIREDSTNAPVAPEEEAKKREEEKKEEKRDSHGSKRKGRRKEEEREKSREKKRKDGRRHSGWRGMTSDGTRMSWNSKLLLAGEKDGPEVKEKTLASVPVDLEALQKQLSLAERTAKELQSEMDFSAERFTIYRESTETKMAELEADRDNLLVALSSMHQVEIIPMTLSVGTQVEAELSGSTFTLFEVVSERGVAYRRSYGNLKDRVIDMLGPTYGESVAAQEVRGDWIYTIDGFWLPTIVDGLVALVPARNNGNLDQNLGDKLHSIWSRYIRTPKRCSTGKQLKSLVDPSCRGPKDQHTPRAYTCVANHLKRVSV